MDSNKPRATKRLGFLNDGLRSDWSFLSWEGMSDEAAKQGAVFIMFDGNIINENFNYQYQNNMVYTLPSAGSIDALISWHGVISHYLEPEAMRSFYESLGVPVVLIEGRIDGFSSVEYPNSQGIGWVYEHLASVHGHTRIGYMGMYSGHPGFDQRWEGFKKAQALAGLESRLEWEKPFWEVDTEQVNGIILVPVFEKWLRKALDSGMQALVCVTDSIAIQVIERLQIMGIKVPEDLAVTGFDGFIDSQCMIPPLTTLKPDWTGLGTRAFRLALDRASSPQDESSSEIGMELVVRTSCGCREHYLEFAGKTLRPENLEDWKTLIKTECPRNGTARREAFIDSLVDLALQDGQNEERESFVYRLDQELLADEMEGRNVLAWYRPLSLLESLGQTVEQEGNPGQAARHRQRLTQAFLMTGGHAEHGRLYQRFQDVRRRFFERFFIRQLVSTFDLVELGALLDANLESLGIRGIWVVLFDNVEMWRFPDSPPETARLTVASDPLDSRPLPSGGIRFNPRSILPEELGILEVPGSYLVHSLHFQSRQIGYLVYRVGVHDGWLYETLTRQISGMLEGNLMVRQIDSHANSLAQKLEELKRTQQHLVAREKMAVLGTMVAGMAHELNTPLGIAVTSSAYLQGRVREFRTILDSGQVRRSEIDEFMESLEQATGLLCGNLGRAAELMGSFKQVSVDQTSEKFRTFNMATCIEDTLRSLNPMIRKKGLEVLVECPPRLIIQGVPGIWSQVLTNLIMNSVIHAFPAGGPGHISICLQETEGFLTLFFKDDGTGLSEEDLAHLYEPFRTSMLNKGGSGLGTWLIYLLVTQQLGGTIASSSPPGEGLCYEIRIPRAAQAPGEG